MQYYRRALSGGENKIFIMKPGSRPPREAQFPAHFPISLDIKWCTKNIWGEKKEKDMKWWMCRVFLCVTLLLSVTASEGHMGPHFTPDCCFGSCICSNPECEMAGWEGIWSRGCSGLTNMLWASHITALIALKQLSQSRWCTSIQKTSVPSHMSSITSIQWIKVWTLFLSSLITNIPWDVSNSYYYPKMFSFHGSKSNTMLRIFLTISAKFNIKKSIFSDRNLWNDATIHANYSVLKTSHYVYIV